MSLVGRVSALRFLLVDRWRQRALGLKAISFAFVGVINTVVDYSIFLIARSLYVRSPAALGLFAYTAETCRCASAGTVALIVANMTSWIIAVSGSYVLNSSITFAAESGRKLSWRAYGTFIAAGVIGWLANTATLVFAAQVLLLPVWAAKAFAILASFCVNFSLSHFVVFRVRRKPVGEDA
jgi:putative flippase GtrA